MSAKAVVISESVATLDEDVVIEALGRHGMNVSATADELGVPSAELRKLLWARPKFVAAADEMVERHLDMGEANIFEAARGANAKLRFLAGCFITRYSTKASRRGWLTNAPAGVETAVNVEPRRITISWRTPDGEPVPPPPTEKIQRDDKTFELPTYGSPQGVPADGTGDTVLSPAAHGGDHLWNASPEPLKQIGPVSDEPAAVSPALLSIPSPPASPTLPVWPGPGGPPPLVANRYQPWTPPQLKAQPRRERELALEPEERPQRASVYRPSRGGWR